MSKNKKNKKKNKKHDKWYGFSEVRSPYSHLKDYAEAGGSIEKLIKEELAKLNAETETETRKPIPYGWPKGHPAAKFNTFQAPSETAEKLEEWPEGVKSSTVYWPPSGLTFQEPLLPSTKYGSFAVERCAGTAFVLGLDGARWFTTTQLRAETIATVLNNHLEEYMEVRADILKRKGGVEV